MLQLTNWFKPRKSKVEKSLNISLNVGYNSHEKLNKRFFTTKRGAVTRVNTTLKETYQPCKFCSCVRLSNF